MDMENPVGPAVALEDVSVLGAHGSSDIPSGAGGNRSLNGVFNL